MSKPYHQHIEELIDIKDTNKLNQFISIFMDQSFNVKEAMEQYIVDPSAKNAQTFYNRLSVHTRLSQAAQRKFYSDTHQTWHRR